MKQKKRETGKSPAAAAPAVPPRKVWPWIAGVLGTLVLVFQVYGPVLNGPFLFDDDYLPFRVPNFPEALRYWLTAGIRPMLMLTYWVNFQISRTDTLWYHIFNVLFHAGAGVLVFAILRRLLALASVAEDRRALLAAFGAGLFLLHPVQTESVAYVASRSESLSVMLFLAAYAVFLCRRTEAVSWLRAAAVLLLFGAAMASKEHTLVLPALLLLTDFYWNPGFSTAGIRRNWRLYAPMAVGAAIGVAGIWKLLTGAKTAGFGIKDVTWYQYFFTQCRALFVYLRLFVLPYGQSADYDFAWSRTPFEHGAIFGLIVLAGITVAVWIWRRRWPLASFGWFAFLILMAPTSSIMPIKDPVAERRMYLSMLALLVITLEFVRRARVTRVALAGVLAAVLLVAAVLTYNRNLVWTDRITLWQDTIAKSPGKARAHFQLGYAYYELGQCDAAVPHYQRVEQIQGPAYDLMVDWALAYDCMNRPDDAIAKLRRAAALERKAHAFSLMGMVYGKQSRWQEALDALGEAEKLDPAYAMTYVYRGGVKLGQGETAEAVANYRHALALEPGNEVARQALGAAEQRLRTR